MGTKVIPMSVHYARLQHDPAFLDLMRGVDEEIVKEKDEFFKIDDRNEAERQRIKVTDFEALKDWILSTVRKTAKER